MKNVSCRKLLIDRSKAPEKLGTLKDISLFGSYEFPTYGPNTGGVVARSLAGIGKESKKTEQQLKSLANRRTDVWYMYEWEWQSGGIQCPIHPT